MARGRKPAEKPQPVRVQVGDADLENIILVGNSILKDWGGRIERHRNRAGLDQHELAALLKVSSMTVARWERGEMEPRLKHKLRIAQELNVDVRDLFPLAGMAA